MTDFMPYPFTTMGRLNDQNLRASEDQVLPQIWEVAGG